MLDSIGDEAAGDYARSSQSPTEGGASHRSFSGVHSNASYLGSLLAAKLKDAHVTAVTGEIDDEQCREELQKRELMKLGTDC